MPAAGFPTASLGLIVLPVKFRCVVHAAAEKAIFLEILSCLFLLTQGKSVPEFFPVLLLKGGIKQKTIFIIKSISIQVTEAFGQVFSM